MGRPGRSRGQLLSCAIRAGAGTATKVHGLGDGAVWIVSQVEQQFGLQGSYLVDFYHLCEYLSAAAERIDPRDNRAWLAIARSKETENEREPKPPGAPGPATVLGRRHDLRR